MTNQPTPKNYETGSIDRLFLELSQFTKATTNKEMIAEEALNSIIHWPSDDSTPIVMRLRLIAKEALRKMKGEK